MLAAFAGPDGPTVSRRSLLAAAAAGALALAGCTGGDDPEPGPSETAALPPPPDPDAALTASVVDTAAALADSYAATAVAYPDLTAVLAPLLADHRAHLATLTPAATATPSSTSTPSVGGTGTPTSSAPTGEPVPADPGAALEALRDSEQSAAEVARSGAVAAADPALARLFASIAASRALHARTLDDQ